MLRKAWKSLRRQGDVPQTPSRSQPPPRNSRRRAARIDKDNIFPDMEDEMEEGERDDQMEEDEDGRDGSGPPIARRDE